jgi:hypothetical protein
VIMHYSYVDRTGKTMNSMADHVVRSLVRALAYRAVRNTTPAVAMIILAIVFILSILAR